LAVILIAEDDPGTREITRVILEKSGHRTLEAATGTESLETLRREKVDLLVLDIMLPGVDGHTVLMKLARDPERDRLPVIVLTALNYTKDMFAKFPQVRAFLTKPFTPADLDGAVALCRPTVKP